MKFLTVTMMALTMLGISAGGSYFFFKQSAVASAGAVNEVAKAAKHSKIQNAEADVANLKFVKLDPLILPIIDGSGVTQVVTLVVVLEVPGELAEERTRQLSPRLKDAFIQDTYGVLNRKAALSGGLLKVERLKQRLQKIAVEVLGAENINQVLLDVVQQDPV